MSSIRIPYEDDDTQSIVGFKSKIDHNVSGLSIPDINQAFVFRRMDMFANTDGESLVPRMSKVFSTVIDFQNYNESGDIPNISIPPILLNGADNVLRRNAVYSRVGYPTSGKRNWASMSNNFKIFKVINNDGGPNKYVEFPKAVTDNDLNTVISFTSIDIDFEGTYIDTARSDVSVKVRFTLDNFSLLEDYYNANGQKWRQDIPPFTDENVNPEDSFFRNYVRFLDLLQPPEIQSVNGFPNKGIVLDVYANYPSDPDANASRDDANNNTPALRNELQVMLYLVDHTLTFNEETNKVDIEVEYRAAADIPIFDKDPISNVLYTAENKLELKKLLNTRKEQRSNGCLEAARDTTDKINEIEKYSLKDRVGAFEIVYENTTGDYFRVERYEYGHPAELSTLQKYDAQADDGT